MAVKIISKVIADKLLKAGCNTKDDSLKEFISECAKKKGNKQKKIILGEYKSVNGNKIEAVTKEKEKVILSISTRTNISTGSIINLYDTDKSPFLFSLDVQGKQLIKFSDRLFIELSVTDIPLYVNFQD